MVERPILKFREIFGLIHRIDQIEASARPAALALAPEDGDFCTKFRRNSMECANTNEAGLFLTMSRVNHDCLGNAEHCFLENRDMKTIIACRAIACGEEVSISYVDLHSKYAVGRKEHLLQDYKFNCNCSVCTDPDVEADVDQMCSLDDEILFLPRLGMSDLALRKGQALLALYDKRNMSSWYYSRTYFDLFQISAAMRQTVAAQSYVRYSYELALAVSHDESCDYVVNIKRFLLEVPSYPYAPEFPSHR
jgi:SET domain